MTTTHQEPRDPGREGGSHRCHELHNPHAGVDGGVVLVFGRLGFILIRVEESRNRNDDGAQDDAEYLPISGGSKCQAIETNEVPIEDHDHVSNGDSGAGECRERNEGPRRGDQGRSDLMTQVKGHGTCSRGGRGAQGPQL